MRARFVNEIFVEDSDPIEDMKIGRFQQYMNLRKGDILKVTKDLTFTGCKPVYTYKKGWLILMHDINKKPKETDTNMEFNFDVFKTEKSLKLGKALGPPFSCDFWSLDFDFFKDYCSLKKDRPDIKFKILHLKKEGENSHHGNGALSPYAKEGSSIVLNIILDDFVASGETVNRIHSFMKRRKVDYLCIFRDLEKSRLKFSPKVVICENLRN